MPGAGAVRNARKRSGGWAGLGPEMSRRVHFPGQVNDRPEEPMDARRDCA
jgi:hypothetical protein